MKKIKYLILGAGISGLSFAYYLKRDDYLILEKENIPGGLLQTIKKQGFTWDYSGHFLHFKNEILKKNIETLMGEKLLHISPKITSIYYKGRFIDYPFQKNIHQLNKSDFIDCIYYLFNKKPKAKYSNFREMLLGKFGKGICEKFLFPYNEKLYSTDLNNLDAAAIGRFFPDTNIKEIIENFKNPENSSYNTSFIYPKDGIYSFLELFIKNLIKIKSNEEIRGINISNKIVKTKKEEYKYKFLINTIPLNEFLNLCNIQTNNILNHNKVLVFNLGFDSESNFKNHWIYFPDKNISFYRVGFYNNILNENLLSLYVEIGFKSKKLVDIKSYKKRVLYDLKRVGIIENHNLLADHHVIINPAYCFISKDSKKFVSKIESYLSNNNIYLCGRYAQWIYCSIEDNIIRAKGLANKLS